MFSEHPAGPNVATTQSAQLFLRAPEKFGAFARSRRRAKVGGRTSKAQGCQSCEWPTLIARARSESSLPPADALTFPKITSSAARPANATEIIPSIALRVPSCGRSTYAARPPTLRDRASEIETSPASPILTGWRQLRARPHEQPLAFGVLASILRYRRQVH